MLHALQNMPAAGEGPDVGKMAMVGWQMVLIAARYGVKYAAVVTRGNHHKDVTSRMIDYLGSNNFCEWEPVEYEINGARVGFWHDPDEDSSDGKGWDKVLKRLMDEKLAAK